MCIQKNVITEKEGLRVIATYKCDRNCPFCYQSLKKSEYLEPDKFRTILNDLKSSGFIPIYITFQGGEITIQPHTMFELIKISQEIYPQVFRKSITSNGYAPIEVYQESALYGITHLSFSLHRRSKVIEDKIIKLKSSGFFTFRVNCFANISDDNIPNLKYVYDFCKENQIQLTFCEDLRFVEVEDTTNVIVEKVIGHTDIEILKFKHQTILRDYKHNFLVWIYKHLDHYDYNNWIVLPTGKLTDTFDDVINGLL